MNSSKEEKVFFESKWNKTVKKKCQYKKTIEDLRKKFSREMIDMIKTEKGTFEENKSLENGFFKLKRKYNGIF